MRPAFLGVHFEHPIEILRHIDDDGFADGLSGEARARLRAEEPEL